MLERTVISLFSLNKRAKPSLLYIIISLLDLNLVSMILVIYVKSCGQGLISTLSLINLKIDMIVVN